MTTSLPSDERIPKFIDATNRLRQGQFDVEVPFLPPDDVGQLGAALSNLSQVLERRAEEARHLSALTTRINSGLLLDEILEGIYQDFREFIPYNRIGFGLLEQGGQILRARWAKTDLPTVRLNKGFSAPMAGSSLEPILASGQPRILNDLPGYLRAKPKSTSTQLIVEEGLRSSLTCPLIANGVPVGFMFFSSIELNTYAAIHVDTFRQIAGQLSVMVEKGRLVSELSQQKSEIEAQNEQLRRLNDVKNSFLGMAAHDLRNPLATIQLATEVMLDPRFAVSDEDRRTFLTDIDTQSRYMLSLLYDLLDVSQIESGQVSLQPVPIALAAFLAETVQRHARLAEPKHIRVILEPVEMGQVLADPLRLRQVLDNLISNAVKFTPAVRVVQVSARRLDSGWRIAIRDQGPGLTIQDRERMFEDFARLSAQPTGGEKSTGLGLAITRRVVIAHGGQIGVDSPPGEGATFWFTLPESLT